MRAYVDGEWHCVDSRQIAQVRNEYDKFSEFAKWMKDKIEQGATVNPLDMFLKCMDGMRVPWDWSQHGTYTRTAGCGGR